MSSFLDPNCIQWYEHRIYWMARRYKKSRDGDNMDSASLKYHVPLNVNLWLLFIALGTYYPIGVIYFLLIFCVCFKSRICCGIFIATPNIYYDSQEYETMKYPVWKYIKSDDPKIKERNTKTAIYALLIFLMVTVIYLVIYIIKPELGSFLFKVF